MRTLWLVVVLLGLSGCTSVPTMTSDAAGYVSAVSFQPLRDRGVIYLYRDRTSHFGLFHLDVHIDGESFNTSPACFVRFEAVPGRYDWEADHPTMFGFEDEMELEVRAGDVVFLEYKPISRFMVPGSTKIIPRDAATAKATITSQKLCALPTVALRPAP